MATAVSQHGHHIGHHLGHLENFILCKIAANFTEISRNRNTVKNSLKKEIRTNFLKNLQFSILNFKLNN